MSASIASGLAGISAGNGSSPSVKPDPRLGPAAHEFEACLMKEFLQPLQHDALFDEDKDKANDNGAEGSGGALMSFGSEALARAISERGGFGIATKILSHFGQGTGQQTGQAADGKVPDTEKKTAPQVLHFVADREK